MTKYINELARDEPFFGHIERRVSEELPAHFLLSSITWTQITNAWWRRPKYGGLLRTVEMSVCPTSKFFFLTPEDLSNIVCCSGEVIHISSLALLKVRFWVVS